MLKDFIYDIRAIKYRCIQAYFFVQLEEAEELAQKGIGQVCAKEYDFVRGELIKIMDIIKSNNNDFDSIEKLAKANPFIKPYYNEINKIVKKHFALGCDWIPSLPCIEVLRLFQEKGYKDFNDIDFLKLQSKFETFERTINEPKEEKINFKKKTLLKVHFDCARDIVEGISKKKVFKRNKK